MPETPAHPRAVAALVDDGDVRDALALIRKAASKALEGIRTDRTLKALELLDTLTALFPERTSSPEWGPVNLQRASRSGNS